MSEKSRGTIHIKWVRSGIGFSYRQKNVVRSLGFKHLNQVVERPDTAQIRGMVARVARLVEIIDSPAEAKAAIPEVTIEAALPAESETAKAAGGSQAESAETAATIEPQQEAEQAGTQES